MLWATGAPVASTSLKTMLESKSINTEAQWKQKLHAQEQQTQVQQSQVTMQVNDPPQQNTTTLSSPLHCLQPLLLWNFKISTDPIEEPVAVYTRHISSVLSASITSVGYGAV